MQKQKKSKRINCLGHGRVRPRAEGPRQRLSLLKHANYIGGASAVALGLLALVLISPNVTEGASAEEVTTALNIEMQPVVSVGIGKAVNLSFTPGSAGEFQNGSTKLTVSTNQIDGYQILMSTEGDSADITNIDAAGVIKSIVGSNIATSDFAANSWGYSINPAGETASSYNAVPNTVTQIKHVTTGEVTAGRADEYNLNFGAKVNNTLPAGNYNKLITISVVTNPIDVNNLQHLTYMQDMTHDICANTKDRNGNTNITPGNEVTKQLIDVRDGKKYWVSKLADQNCWMVQNLAYNITQERINNNEINPTNTDVSEIWNASSAYPPTATETITPERVVDSGPVNATRSWSVGDYILKAPTEYASCNVVTGQTFSTCDKVSEYKPGANEHYLLGNYYQWNTAVAGTGDNLANYNAPSSICPKNWQLPTADESRLNSFYNLLTYYNLTASIYNASYNLSLAPFYFVRGGDLYLTDGAFNSVGNGSNYISSTIDVSSEDGSKILILGFNGQNTSASSLSARKNGGFSVRCLAR